MKNLFISCKKCTPIYVFFPGPVAISATSVSLAGTTTLTAVAGGVTSPITISGATFTFTGTVATTNGKTRNLSVTASGITLTSGAIAGVAAAGTFTPASTYTGSLTGQGTLS